MSLFINQIANSSAGIVTFSLPDGNGSYVEVRGFLSEDPNISMKNTWEPALPDITALSDFSQLSSAGAQSWIATSKAIWKNTDPITINLNFYLITYLKKQIDGTGTGLEMPISKQAAYFAQLAAVSQALDGETNWFKQLAINVHGGYRPDIFETNASIMNTTENKANTNSFIYNKLLNNGQFSDSTGWNNGEGTIQMVINGGEGGRSLTLTKMLLADINFTPSTVRTGYWDKPVNNGVSQTANFHPSSEPLYIKVNATFRMMHTATTTDAIRMFTGGVTL